MTKFLALAIALILAAGAAIGCAVQAQGESKSSPAATVEVSCDQFQEPGKQHIVSVVDLAVGSSLTVSLCSNPTTGFEWEQAVISDPTVLAQSGDNLVPVEQATPRAGAPGTHIWTFKALKQGTSTITMSYSRPWAGGEKGVWTFTLTATVK